MARKHGLKRGLDALISDAQPAAAVTVETPPQAAPLSADKAPADGELRRLPVEWLKRGRYQPRRDMAPDALEELAESIRVQGIMQPIVVRPLPTKNRFEIIAGERRWRAAQLAELDTIPAIIRDVDDAATIAMALIENLQREDLNPMEEAFAMARLKDEFSLTHQQVADAVGKSRTMVTNLLRLTALEADVKTLVEHGDLEMGHARALLALQNDDQVDAARQVAAKGLSVRQTEALVRDFGREKEAKPAPKREDPNIRKLTEDLSDRLGTSVKLNQGKGGRGKLVISYSSLDELDGILSHIQ